jgi:TRAP-type uncharacterized transport system substrate-binding protein
MQTLYRSLYRFPSGRLMMAALICAFSMNAMAQVPLISGSGGKSGNYYKFMNEAVQVCPGYGIQVRETGGTPDNLDGIDQNELAMAPAQLDVLALYRLGGRDVANYRILVPLFPEVVHFMTRNNVTTVTGQKEIFGRKIPGTGTEVSLSTVEDLRGRTVVAAGGSFKTAQVINQLSGLGMNLVDAGTADNAVKMVAAGTADAVILVGFPRLGTITDLKQAQSNFRLLPVNEAIFLKIGKTYSRSFPLSYPGMGQGGDNIVSLQTMSAIVVQNYGKSATADQIAGFRDCLLINAKDMAGTPGKSPAWRNLKLDASLGWESWTYQIGPSAPAGAAQPARPVKR